LNREFSDEELKKLKEIITEGIQVHTEIDTLKGGLSDTVKAIAEELDIKPAMLNKAIRTAFKADLEVKRSDLTYIEDLLSAVGRDY
jgi:hypothetical protein